VFVHGSRHHTTRPAEVGFRFGSECGFCLSSSGLRGASLTSRSIGRHMRPKTPLMQGLVWSYLDVEEGRPSPELPSASPKSTCISALSSSESEEACLSTLKANWALWISRKDAPELLAGNQAVGHSGLGLRLTILCWFLAFLATVAAILSFLVGRNTYQTPNPCAFGRRRGQSCLSLHEESQIPNEIMSRVIIPGSKCGLRSRGTG